MRGTDRGSIKSAERALAIVEYFDMIQRSASVKELSEALEIPQSSTSMLLKCLTTLGYVQKGDGLRDFAPGVRTAFLGNWAQRQVGKGNPLCDTADEIARELDETVVVGTQNGPYVQYLYISARREPGPTAPRAGTKRLMACTAAGRSLLSRLAEPDVRRIVRRNNAEAEAHNRVPEKDLLDRIRQEKRQGYFESQGGLVAGISSITVLLAASFNGTPLVLGVGGPADRLSQSRGKVIDALVAAASRPASELAPAAARIN